MKSIANHWGIPSRFQPSRGSRKAGAQAESEANRICQAERCSRLIRFSREWPAALSNTMGEEIKETLGPQETVGSGEWSMAALKGKILGLLPGCTKYLG